MSTVDRCQIDLSKKFTEMFLVPVPMSDWLCVQELIGTGKYSDF